MTDLLDEVCAWVRGGSRVSADQVAAMTHMDDDARLMAEAFTGEEGRKRLMIFARMTVLRPAVDVRLPAAEGLAYAQLRQGQDTVFAALVRYLDIHAEKQRRLTDGPERQSEPEPGADAWSADAGADAGSWDAAGLIGGR